MSKTVHPYSHRLVTLRDWKSRWFKLRRGNAYQDALRADLTIRRFLAKSLRRSYISRVEIERSRTAVRVLIFTSRPGMVIGRGGDGAQKLRSGLDKTLKKGGISLDQDLKIDIIEVSQPESDASIVSQMVAEGLERRMPFRRVLKMTLESTMAVPGVEGARIWISGRLNGAEMARSEQVRKGSIPLQTIRADIDYARERARLPYGTIGIKVWIYKGEVFDDKK
jgi:small subunit ribosomal protein S3